MEFRLILASQSPRRKQLLESAGLKFEIHPSQIEEKMQMLWKPEYCVQELARQKAEDVVLQMRKKYPCQDNTMLILSADTVVALDNEIFGKPKNTDDAYQMLWKLSRNRHQVCTGVCLWPLTWSQGLIGYANTFVTMYPLHEAEIYAYIESGEPMGKAGAYAIQENADRFVKKIEGPWDNVVGLPMDLVWQLINQWRQIHNKILEDTRW